MSLHNAEQPMDSSHDSVPGYPLHDAIERGTMAEVASIINAETDVNLFNDADLTPLMVAVRSDSTETLELLLKSGADAGKSNQSGYSVLHHAAGYGTPDQIRILIDAGCEIESLTYNGNGLLHIACMNDNLESCKFLRKKKGWI